MITTVLLKILSSGVIQQLVKEFLVSSVTDPKTGVDTKLVLGVTNALAGKDSGLQRKPTGPRKKK